MSGYGPVYKTNEPNECAQCVWLWEMQGLFSSNAIAKTFNSWRHQRVHKGELLNWESESSSNIVRVGVWIVNQWWIRMIFRHEFSVPKVCSARSIQATHACHSEVSMIFLVCGLQSDLLWHFSMSAPCFHVTKTTKQWRIVEIELLASAGWKCCCQPFSCPCSQNVTHCRKEICSTWWTSKDPIPTRSFRDLLYIQWLCSQSDCCKPMNNCRDWAFSNSGLEIRRPAFQPLAFEKCDSLPKRDLCDIQYLSKESIPAIPFWNSKHPIPTRSYRFLRAAVWSELWLHHAHAFDAAEGKHLSHAEKQRVWSRSCGLQDVLQYSDFALSRALWLLQTNELLSRLSF